MSINELLEKINNRQNQLALTFAFFPQLDFSSFPYGLTEIEMMVSQKKYYLKVKDDDIRRLEIKAAMESFVFEYYFLKLGKLKASNDEESEKIRIAKSHVRLILINLYKIAGFSKKTASVVIASQLKRKRFVEAIETDADDSKLLKAFIEKWKYVNFRYLPNNFPLICSIINGDYAKAERLIKSGARIEGLSENYETPLLIASKSDLKTVQLLVKAGADVNREIPFKKTTPLIAAIMSDKFSIVKFLLDTIESSTPAKFNLLCESAFYYACRHGCSAEMLQFLLLNIPDMNKKFCENIHKNDYTLRNPLLGALKRMDESADSAANVEFLLKVGLSEKDVLCQAVPLGAKVVKLMLYAGYQCTAYVLNKAITYSDADTEMIDLIVRNSNEEVIEEAKHRLIKNSNFTDLIFYATIGNIEKIKHLLAPLVDGCELQLMQTSPLNKKLLGNVESLDTMPPRALSPENQKIITLKTDHVPIDFCAEDREGHTALMKAVMLNRTEIVRLLLKSGTKVNHVSDKEERRFDDGHTALMKAVIFNRTEMVQLLLESGANVNHTNCIGLTVLIKAAELGHVDIVKVLLKYNPNVNQPGTTDRYHYKKTALYLATENGHAEIVDALLSIKGINTGIYSGYTNTENELGVNSKNEKIADSYKIFNAIVVL
jgi:ankyrin repeat protein